MAPQPKANWDNVDLGKRPDQVIADELGLSMSAVRTQRHKRGIPGFKVNKFANIKWEEQPLGQISDNEIAEQLGISAASVSNARNERGIQSYENCFIKLTDWDKQPLGEIHDYVIAQQTGTSPSTVAEQRQKRGLTSYKSKLAPNSNWWDNQPLGQLPDKWLAKKLDTASSTVSAARNYRDIPTFSGGVRTQEGFACDSQIEALYDTYLHWQNIEHEHQINVPGTKYIADFRINGVYVEVVGMLEYERYAKKAKTKRADCESLGHQVQWLEREEIEALTKDCPVLLKFTPERACRSCGEFARYQYFCKKCYQATTTDPRLIKLCKRESICNHCDALFGYNVANVRQYCSSACSYAAQVGVEGQTDWDNVGLGTKPDKVLAEELGYQYVTVAGHRRKRGIPVWSKLGTTDWDSVGLGDRPDQEIADEFGYKLSTVKAERQKRKIPLYKTSS